MSQKRLYACSLFAVCFWNLNAEGLPVTGRATDPSGAAVPHASVSFEAAEWAVHTATDALGMYRVLLPRGSYLVEARAPGLLSPPDTVILVTGALELPLRLAPRAAASSVQVTASGTPRPVDDAAKSVDVIDRSELETRGVRTAADALRELPGLRVEQRGGPGYFTTIQIRGLRTYDTAILIDGIRFRDVGATQGDASSFLSDLLLADTARVEVLRGSGSSLYGTNAIGGAIDLVTDPGGEPWHATVLAEGGGLGEFRGFANFGGGARGNRLHYSAGLGHQNVTNNVGGYGTYRNTTGDGLLDYAVRPGVTASVRLLATDVYGQLNETPTAVAAGFLPRTGYIQALAPSDAAIRLAEQGLPYPRGSATFLPALGDPDYYRTARYFSTLAALKHQASTNLSYRLSYQALLTNRDVVNGPLGAQFQPAYRSSNQFNGRIDTVRGQVNYLAGRHNLLSAAYEFERESFDSPSSDRNPNLAARILSRTQVAEWSHSADAQDQIQLLSGRLQISLSGRLQHFALGAPRFLGTAPAYAAASATSPPDAYTGDVSAAYLFRQTGTKIRTHGGNGYRKPSLYELFGTSFFGGSYTAYGDPRLKPDRSIAIDGGIDQYFAADRARVSATYFYTRLQQVIAFDSSGLIGPATDPFGRSSGYRNTGGAMARGVELSAELRPLRSTRLRTSYTYTNARDRTSQFADGTLQVPRITPHSFGLLVLQQWGKHVDASLDLQASSDYLYQLSRRTFVFPGRRQVAFSMGYSRPLGERSSLRLFTRCNNAGDQTYYGDGFRTPGRWFTTGMSLSF